MRRLCTAATIAVALAAAPLLALLGYLAGLGVPTEQALIAARQPCRGPVSERERHEARALEIMEVLS